MRFNRNKHNWSSYRNIRVKNTLSPTMAHTRRVKLKSTLVFSQTVIETVEAAPDFNIYTPINLIPPFEV